MSEKKMNDRTGGVPVVKVKKARFPFAGMLLIMLVVNVLLIGVLALLLLGGGPFELFAQSTPAPTLEEGGVPASPVAEVTPSSTLPPATDEPAPTDEPVATDESAPSPEPSPMPTATPPYPPDEEEIVFGYSVEGRELVAYRMGNGPSARAIVGGIHGGYEWNTVRLVTETLEYYRLHPDYIPEDVTFYIIPCLNPDGLALGRDILEARVNANGVDLNRNWDYQWQMTATHGTRPISAGSAEFSEPETASMRDFIHENDIELLIFYHSAMNRIFSGAERTKCATYQLAEDMSSVTGYPHQPEGVPGQITTGDAIDYLSDVGITAIEIELINHQDIDWDQNILGIDYFLRWQIPGESAETVPEAPPGDAEYDFIIHILQPGELLSTIVYSYGVDLDTLLYYNDDITNPDLVQEGQEIIVPIPRSSEE